MGLNLIKNNTNAIMKFVIKKDISKKGKELKSNPFQTNKPLPESNYNQFNQNQTFNNNTYNFLEIKGISRITERPRVNKSNNELSEKEKNELEILRKENQSMEDQKLKMEESERNCKELESKLKSREEKISLDKENINNLSKKIMTLESQNELMNNNKNELQKQLNKQQDKIKELENKQTEKDDKSKEELDRLIKNNKKKIDRFQLKLEEQKKEYEKKLKESEEENKKKIDDLQKQIQEEKDQYKKNELKKQREIYKEERALKYIYDKKFKEFKLDKLKLMLKDFEETGKDFCLDDISKFSIENIKNLIIKSFKSEKVINPIKFHLDTFIEEAINNLKSVDHLNIILVGPAGVGKTTLINTLLGLDLKTGFGAPQTQNIEFNSSEEIPFLRLVDSKGIEKENSGGVDPTFESINNFIDSQLETNDPDKFIHCIWYCWTMTRLENVEINLLKKLSQQYTLDKLPVIIVYTNAISPDDVEKAKEYIKNENLNNDFIDILFLEKKMFSGESVKPHGLDKLIELSIKSAMSAVNSSCYEGLLRELKKNVEETLDSLMNIIKEKINIEIEDMISKINEQCNIEDLNLKLTKIFIDIFYYFIFLNPNIEVEEKNGYKATIKTNFGDLDYTISLSSMSNIHSFIKDYFNEILQIYEKNLKNLVEKHKKELLDEVKTFQMDFIVERGKMVKRPNKKTLENALECDIFNNISKIAQTTALKNFFSYITTPLIENFTLFFKEAYQEGMKRKEFIEKGKAITKISFDKIEEKIKEYNDSKKKEKEEKSDNDSASPIKNDNDKKNIEEIKGLWDEEENDEIGN